ncbi:MAG: ElyC/SanA/YdcF family protein [Mixta calida]|mgnify:CR=1 FL=1|uniref:ElyC/SanA/YdcF family protein n=1 Tax=Pantoea TaxID=53335 RepID=UPI0006605496|nr:MULTISPECIES: ElyC/SanA/YdcF family protein [Pantoea]MBS6435278.1 YdcF family protein [Pantoea sp.]MDU2729967.1 ElyC/SanA/YdcF family protein [Pantoea sp.]MDU2734670.1 ElyC/SanA/YdcF family protein [Mixta calida]
MQLNHQAIQDLNLIAAWLSLDDMPVEGDIEADMAILAGHAVLPNIEGAVALAKRFGLPLLLSGGIGHATGALAQAMALHPLYRDIETRGKSEAQMLAAIARVFGGLDEEDLLLEEASRNSGENAAFSQRLLDARQLRPQRVVLIQDPLLQRRADATFRWQWRERDDAPRFINWPVFTPVVTLDSGMARITGAPPQGLWSLERFVRLLMGEVQRLRNDEQGYGPRGAGFFGEVEMPDAVDAAWHRLMQLPAAQAQLAARRELTAL